MRFRDYVISVKIGASFAVLILLVVVSTATAMSRLNALEDRTQSLLGAKPAATASTNAASTDAVSADEIRELRRSHTLIRVLMLATNLVILALVLIIATWTIRHVSIPLHTAAQLARRVADGDLTASATSSGRNDEIGWLNDELTRMAANFKEIAGGVRGRTDFFVTSTHELAQETDRLAQRTESQASSLEQTAASMEELAATVKENADHARQARQFAADAGKVSLKGQEVMGAVVATMASISQSSRKISDILGLIDSIAFQTNILALNAAVEAARAGDQGRGFAVVAGEVRSLAKRAADAAKEIKTLLQESAQRAEQGNTLVNEAGAAIGETARSVQRVTDIMDAIVNASREQSDGVHQVSVAVTHMDSMTQENASLASRSASAVKALEEQSHHLAQLVSRFKLAPQDIVVIKSASSHQEDAWQANPAAPKLRRPSAPPQSDRSSARTHRGHAAPAEDWTEF